MKHKHHVVPRYAGGTDEISNLIEVTVEEHAELHFARYLEFGDGRDWLAYHSLSAQATSEWWISYGGHRHSDKAKLAIGKSKLGNTYALERYSLSQREKKNSYSLHKAWASVEAALATGTHHWGNKQLSKQLGVSSRTLSKISAAIRRGETFNHWSGENL